MGPAELHGAQTRERRICSSTCQTIRKAGFVQGFRMLRGFVENGLLLWLQWHSNSVRSRSR